MEHDGMLVNAETAFRARQQLHAQGLRKAMETLREQEPWLAQLVYELSTSVSGKLALMGVANSAIVGSNAEMLEIALTCITALRLGHYELWKDTALGPRLASLVEGVGDDQPATNNGR